MVIRQLGWSGEGIAEFWAPEVQMRRRRDKKSQGLSQPLLTGDVSVSS